ncbi:MAG: hypothetical protein M1838_000476 [Thelocarpon superellum]|nr:MAG: hypothetical protein M1838_000476 [Thelocarpon superellum]
MPGVVTASRKRKRGERASSQAKSSVVAPLAEDAETSKARILRLEVGILESRRNYNDIVPLIALFNEPFHSCDITVNAAVSLCRVFSRLMAAGTMSKSKTTSDKEAVVLKWLWERHHDYVEGLFQWLNSSEFAHQRPALTLLMKMLKSETKYSQAGGFPRNSPSHLSRIIRTVIESTDGDKIRHDFVEQYLAKFDDVRFVTFSTIAKLRISDESSASPELVSSNILALLSSIETVPSTADELGAFYLGRPHKSKDPLLSLSAHKRQAQEAWLSLLRIGLSEDQRTIVLGLMSQQIAPWFAKVELLMDFLTDSYDMGGSTSLLALSGLFYLIQEKNLDYPSFYPKLYSLLDEDLLRSRHRSRFFRLLDTFLGSTHLPGALVASFIKRMSRLSLFAPPAGVVVVIPWVYNLLKKHPSCTFMVHREVRGTKANEELRTKRFEDPFDMAQQDPMRTGAIDSSLWEVQMLQSHYHPNVATLAKIIGEQFTKHSYNLEDFLDHTYGSMLEAELSKDVKKAPVVEFEIPKKFFTKQADDSVVEDRLLAKLWDFS